MYKIRDLELKLIDRILYHVEDTEAVQKQANKWIGKGLYPFDKIIQAVNNVNAMLESHDYLKLDNTNKIGLLNDYKKSLQ